MIGIDCMVSCKFYYNMIIRPPRPHSIPKQWICVSIHTGIWSNTIMKRYQFKFNKRLTFFLLGGIQLFLRLRLMSLKCIYLCVNPRIQTHLFVVSWTWRERTVFDWTILNIEELWKCIPIRYMIIYKQGR